MDTIKSEANKAKPTPSATKPESIKVEPWADLPRQPYSLFTDDFVHEDIGVLKVNAKSSRGAVNIKQKLSCESGKYSVADDVKIWFGLKGQRTLYTRTKGKALKVHFDNGITQYRNKNWNLYATVTGNRSIQDLSLRLGLAHISPTCNSDTRIKLDQADGKELLTVYNRTLITHNKLVFGFVGAYNIFKNILAKNSLMLGYHIDEKNSVYLRLWNSEFRKAQLDFKNWRSYFETITFNLISNYNANTKLGLEATFQTTGAPFKELELVAQHQLPEQNITLKAKINTRLDLALLVKKPFLWLQEIAQVSVGWLVENPLDAKRSFKNGMQLEFNV